MDEYDDMQAPQFDMGISTLTRINYWLWKCNEASYRDDARDWFKSITNVYKETHAFMKVEKERLEHQDFFKKVEEAYGEFIRVEEDYVMTARFRKMPYNPPRKIFERLFEWELALRIVLEHKGLLMKKSEDATSAVLRT